MKTKSLFLMALLAAATSLSACGRKGPLEAPSASINAPAQSDTAQSAPVEDKPFVLDGLIQ